MRHKRSAGITFILGALLTVLLGISVLAKEKKAPGPKQARLNGAIHSVDKSNSMVTVRRGTEDREVVYTSTTTITYQNKPSTADELKEGRRVIVLGKVNDKKQVEASRIDIREGAKEGK